MSQSVFQKITNGPVISTSNTSNCTAWGDYDNDGYLDFVVSTIKDDCPSCIYPLLVFKNNGQGNFDRVVNNAIAQTPVIGSGLAWGDYDNDNYLDLFVCGTLNSRNKLFHNDQNGNFTEIIGGNIVTQFNSSQSCAWSDYNKDGWLDLFVTNRYGQSNNLYRNNGNGTFTRILSGIIVNDIGDSRCCAWGDYDNDNWPDLFVANYSSQNDFLYHNEHNGTFTKILIGPMVNDELSGSACQWADYDNNGYLDLFVTNSESNRLYYNLGGGAFTVNNSILSQDGNSYGFSWGDYDNDGLIDIFICNRNHANTLYKNNGGSFFTKVLSEIVSQEGYTSINPSMSDYDNDGKLDLFVTNRFSYPYNFLYRNIGNIGNYITIKLKGCRSNRNGIGARIRLVTGNTQQIREASSGNGWDSENSIWPHFGLGNIVSVDSIIVLWPSDTITKFTDVDANRIITISECDGIIGIHEENDKLLSYKLSQNYPNPFNPSTKIYYTIPVNCLVSLKVYNVLGNEIESLVNENKNAGSYEMEWNASNFPNGVYFYKLEAGNYPGDDKGFVETKKMILIK